MPLRINFYGGPGVGKSTIAAKTYAALKESRGLSVELVQEFIKSLAWEGKSLDKFDQVYTFGKQLHREHRLLLAGVDIIVTDSPILLQCFYAEKLCQMLAYGLIAVANEFESVYPALNFFVERSVPYTQEGRYQNAAQAEKLDQQLREMLDNMGVLYLVVRPDQISTIIQTAKEAAYSEKS